MDELLSEKEQIDRMRAWWSDYGAYVIAGIVLGGFALFGYNYYEKSRVEADEQASTMYDALTSHIVDGDLDEAIAAAGELDAEHAGSAYAGQAKLAMARLYMDNARDQDAADVLRELLDSGANDAIKHVARVRLAKILLYQDKADEVVGLLEAQTDEGAFAARYADTLGDAYVMLGRHTDARTAFQRALAEPQQAASVDQQYVQFKLLDLPEDAFASAATVDDSTAEHSTGLAESDSPGDESIDEAEDGLTRANDPVEEEDVE